MSACICTIARNEEPYLVEWLNYHFALGFAQVFLYDNTPDAPSPMMFTLLDKYAGRLFVRHCGGSCIQRAAFADFLAWTDKDCHKWVAVLDLDEFIVLKKHANIIDFLNEHCASGSVSLNWRFFGASGQLKYVDERVLKRFVYCDAQVDQHVKSISCIADIQDMYNSHFVLLKQGPEGNPLRLAYDTNGSPVDGPFNPGGPDDVAVVHHYWCKSAEEYAIKVAMKLTVCGLEKTAIPDDELLTRNNEVFDDSAWQAYQEMVLNVCSS